MIRYYNLTQFAERIGVKRNSMSRYASLPDPDAMTGEVRGWLESTIDDWQAKRPGRGNWKAPEEPAPKATARKR